MREAFGMDDEKTRKNVREGYAKIAKKRSSCCGPALSCCGSTAVSERISKEIGYSENELGSVPEGANLGLGCGNPVALASLKEGEVVLDLGSGAGLDCFLAANKVGEAGRVIGVDMTPEMIDKSRENARKSRHKNVEFRLGEIENLPVADNFVDVVISNCVINLSTDKGRVFSEAFRVLKPGGRLMVSDIVLLKKLPKVIEESVEAYVGCLSGAVMKDKYLELIGEAGFQDVRTVEETRFPVEYMANDPTAKAVIKDLGTSADEVRAMAGSVESVKIHAVKP
jgi:SAM-dependent methyltransferase